MPGIIATGSAVLAVCLLPAFALATDSQSLGTALPLAPTRTIEFDASEGTSTSVDVSPDGSTVVFDLLGDLYALPITGGVARRLTSSTTAASGYPRFSPDGRSIVYISDAGGRFDAWVMDAEGAHPRQVTRIMDALVPSSYRIVPVPVWTADGKALLVRRYVDGRIGIWRYGLTQPGAEQIFSDARCTVQDPPSIAADGETLYTVCWKTDGQLASVDVRDARLTSLPIAARHAYAPLASRDGRWLVYASRVSSSEKARPTQLWLRDLHSVNPSGDRPLIKIIQAVSWHGDFSPAIASLPGMAFTPDSKSLIVSSDGKLLRVDLASAVAAEIPFTAHVNKVLGPLAHGSQQHLHDGPLKVRQLLEPSVSTNGAVAFSAVGKVWIASKGTQPRRLTARPFDDGLREFDPVFSPDSRWVAYCTWSDTQGGRLWKVPAVGGPSVELSPPHKTGERRAYGSPRWASDGKRIVLLTSSVRLVWKKWGGIENEAAHQAVQMDGRIGWLSANGGAMHLLPVNGLPVAAGGRGFGLHDLSIERMNTRAFFLTRSPSARREILLQSIALEAKTIDEARTHLRLVSGEDVRGVVSPDGAWLAIQYRENIALVAIATDRTGAPPIDLDVSNCAAPSVDLCAGSNPDAVVVQVTTAGGFAPKWSEDGRWLTWTRAGTVYRARLRDLLSRSDCFVPQAIPVRLSVPRRLPNQELLMRGARIVTLAANKVIENGEILLKGRRIHALGPAGTIAVSARTRILDLTGTTIIPGLVDIQSGGQEDASALTPLLRTSFAGWRGLSTGITTSWGGGRSSPEFLAREEMRSVDPLPEPRAFVMLDPITPYGDRIGSAEDAVRAYQTRASLAPDTLFEMYHPWDRLQRQWAVQAAVQLDLRTATCGGSEGPFLDRLGVLLDGFTMLEHGFAAWPLKQDVLELWARSGTSWHANGRLEVAEAVRDFQRAGGVVGTSAELEDMRKALLKLKTAGGMTNEEVLRVGTLNGARVLGLDSDLGTIEPGKIADLLVLDGNPLEDLGSLFSIREVLQDGFVYTASTLDRVWPSPKRARVSPWGE